MTLLGEYERATYDGELARLRRLMALRALLATGLTQAEVAQKLRVSQPAVSQQLARKQTDGVFAHDLVAAGGSILREFAAERGFSELAVFGSAARGDDRIDSDIDLLVTPPAAATLLDLARLEDGFAAILGRSVDLVSRRGLTAGLDDDVLRDAVLL